MGTTSDSAHRRVEHAAVGALLDFGAWPQSPDATGPEPIRWRVLDRSGDTVLLLSDRVLDCRRYHRDTTVTTWRDCDLRAWLNGEFLTTAFGDAERGRLEPVTCTGNGDGSPDTVDRVFLLSVEEVRALTDPRGDGPRRRRATGTAVARAPKPDGCRLYVYDKGVERDYLVEDGERRGCSWWWTRTRTVPGDGRAPRAAFVGPRGDVKTYGRVDLACYGVRPALRLRVAGAGAADAADAVHRA
ncbi:DUF6273 domain-containing protein [Streptomyces sp. 549]|uniref:DUF6273 domain-containing protein n=1 Tax=Streptomyces sp. 549 TaxID=3049076 RepID=UPI0024C2D03F|nr:DUF6273 domain-containing protein [Streptomyces sp. 549]MDK1475219.1 DUF6273 domain-containing protein [Streptomyces sp. 549]